MNAVVLEKPDRSFHFTDEGWFGKNTYAGGADKASHFVDFYIISKELAFLYNTLGYSRTESIGIGLGLTLLVGIINESGDGFTKYGFSAGDLAMDVAGGLTAATISALGANDLIGFREGFLLPPYNVPDCCPSNSVGQAYQNQLYTGDLKLAGLARRLNLNIGPLRYLLLSVTYATKGYATGNTALEEGRSDRDQPELEEALPPASACAATTDGATCSMSSSTMCGDRASVGFQYDLKMADAGADQPAMGTLLAVRPLRALIWSRSNVNRDLLVSTAREEPSAHLCRAYSRLSAPRRRVAGGCTHRRSSTLTTTRTREHAATGAWRRGSDTFAFQLFTVISQIKVGRCSA